MKRALLFVMAGLAWCGLAFADTPPQAGDKLKAAYAAYNAAMAKSDLPAAEAAADAALQVAEEAQASPGMIAVLAFNLTQTRLDQSRYLEAVEPARRAYELAKGGAAGVNVIEAQLMLGEALTGQDIEDANKEINAAIAAASAAGSNQRTSIYSASRALGHAAFKKRNWRMALDAWTRTFDNVNPSGSYANAWRGEAMMMRGVSMVYQGDDIKAYEALVQASNLLVPYAGESDKDEVSVAEGLYATSEGWRLAIQGRINSGSGARKQLSTPAPRSQLPGLPPLCGHWIKPVPALTYPRDQSQEAGVGGVVLRLWLNDQGEVVSHKILASIPSESFGEAVIRPHQKFETTLNPAALPGCRKASKDVLQNIVFGIG